MIDGGVILIMSSIFQAHLMNRLVSFMGQRVVYASCPPPGAKDTHAALRAMSNGKSGSTSSIVPELLKGDGLCLRVLLIGCGMCGRSRMPHMIGTMLV